jgi:hypothetical protein
MVSPTAELSDKNVLPPALFVRLLEGYRGFEILVGAAPNGAHDFGALFSEVFTLIEVTKRKSTTAMAVVLIIAVVGAHLR